MAPLPGDPSISVSTIFTETPAVLPANPLTGFIENDRFVEIPSVYHEVPEFTSRPGMMTPRWEHKDADPIIAQKAVEYIERQTDADAPFFLYLTPSAPHEPCTEAVVPNFARGQSSAGSAGRFGVARRLDGR